MKEIKIYPGKDVNGSYIAVPLRNTLVTGRDAVGKSTLIKQVITKLVEEYSYRDIAINFWHSKPVSMWYLNSTERTIPHFQHLCCGEETPLENFLEKVMRTPCKVNICIIDLDDATLTENELELINNLSGHIRLILASRSQNVNKELMKKFDDLFIFNCKPSESVAMLGTEDASRLNNIGRFICHSFAGDFEDFTMQVQYKPDSYYKKFVGVYSQRNTTVVDALLNGSQSTVNYAKVCLAKLLSLGYTIHCTGCTEIKVIQEVLVELGKLSKVSDISDSDIYVRLSKSGSVLITVDTAAPDNVIIHLGASLLNKF